MDNNTTPDGSHYLDRLIWDADNWVAEFNALLDAIEVQFAIEVELSDALDE
jgi:hypothetical protein